tara:strand:- start:59 stop:1063 length:1005 start_codon:yes stop_codon:yes gene_type:complete
MDSLSGNQVKDLKDLYKSIYKVEESTEEASPSSVEEETIAEMPNLPKMGTLFPSEIKKDDNKINFSTNIAGTSINKNQIDKNKNKKLSNIPPAEGSNKKFNPDFGKKPEINKVDTNKVDTNKNNVVKTGPDLNAISKYTGSNRKEVTMKDFQSSDSGVKPEIKPVKSKMNPIEVKNRARFGDDRVDMLKAKNIDFKAMRKGDMTKDAFIKKYPKSITAQKASGLRDEYEPYDLVLDYVLSEGHADSVEEAHYVMMQMDEGTIQTIVEFLGGRPGDGYLGHPNLDIKNPFFRGKRTKGPVLNKSNADKLPDVNVNKVGATIGDRNMNYKKMIDEI